jgi:hypothetical protein
MPGKKTRLIFIYKYILVEIVINLFAYNSLHYFPNDSLSSYLKGRQHKVVIKNNSSAYCEISTGVPQGLVLVPLFRDVNGSLDGFFKKQRIDSDAGN